jgi:hypothetical protein
MNVQKFENWLRGHGCEILDPCTEYELLRCIEEQNNKL